MNKEEQTPLNYEVGKRYWFDINKDVSGKLVRIERDNDPYELYLFDSIEGRSMYLSYERGPFAGLIPFRAPVKFYPVEP